MSIFSAISEGVYGILSFLKGVLGFFKKWAYWIAIGTVFVNVVMFTNSAINDIGQQVKLMRSDKVNGGGQLLFSIMTIIGMVVPANITAVLTLIVSIHILKIGLIVFLSVKRMYWDMLRSLLNK